MDESQAPRVFSERYELNHLIARGGMAEVYRAHDRLLDRPVALKVLFPELSVDRSFVERFRREAQAAANLSHPNIVPVFDWGEDSGAYFIVMEFIDGRPLSSILKTAGPLSADRAADIGSHVAAALGYAHKHGVIHRDVKPGNVLITDEGQVKVTDFGIARAINTEESLTQTGAVMGTATYFSPEQAEGIGVDPRSDIYSLGVVLFEMVTGRAPFLGDTPVAVASKHVRDIPPVPREINPSIPPTFEAIILKSMAKDPDHRYATAEELRADLLRFNEGRSVLAMNDPTAMQAALGATQVVGAVGGVDATQAISAQTRADVVGPGDNGNGEVSRDRNRTRTYVIILVALLVILAIVGVLLARQLGYLGGASSFNLPNVVGKPVAQATTTLKGDGLKVSTTNQATTTYAVGTVLKTDPAAGALVKNGNTVTLTVASAPVVPKVTVPAGITNTDVNTAEGILTQAGLQFTVKNTPNNAQQGQVLSADPNSGTSVNKGSTVTLTVSSGPNSVTVPSVAGLTQTAAANVLGNRGLSLNGTTNQTSTQYQAGVVIGSEPGAGASVPPNSGVTLIVSSGPPSPTTTSSPTTTTSSPTTTTTSPTTTTTTSGLLRRPK
ncbi:MAG TPA: Stk1 family PASTA domain-containing Ser/Thr kinase [Acidimicrobiales bacterium]|jgi:serine/threonine-protein kinase|nr:Stk1 family PASTA domain-containing Ser/Thr kinase [Acidimicrobiales bacterium]